MLQKHSRITQNPAIMGGKPCIRGMRITVGTVLGLLAAGRSEEVILAHYPALEPDDFPAVLAYAADLASNYEVELEPA